MHAILLRAPDDHLARNAHEAMVREAAAKQAVKWRESAVHRPTAETSGQEAYSDLSEKAAARLQPPLTSHPPADGNKRTAWLSCASFLVVNGQDVHADIDAAEEPTIAVAAEQLDDVKLIADHLRDLREA